MDENKDKSTPIDQLSFKEASVELERVVRSLESGDLELEDALGAYARGVELLRSLNERLASAEQQVKVLLESDGIQVPDTSSAPSTMPFQS